MTALLSLLERLKKDVTAVSTGGVPKYLQFLPFSKRISIRLLPASVFDAVFILDCPNWGRTGISKNLQALSKSVIKIDHHKDNAFSADVNLTDASASSAAELIYMIFLRLKMKPTREEASSLYTGIVTDTYNFTQLNTTSQSHIVASDLLAFGVNQYEINKNVYGSYPVSVLKLRGAALSSIKTTANGKVSYISLSLKDFDKTKTTAEDTEGIINFAGMIPGVEVWILFKEMPSGKNVKVGLRSVSYVDVNKIAAFFGGGGHKNAAGCVVPGDIASVTRRVVSYIERCLKK
ncbi:MAG: putative bifunctional oligoribonuclease and PAP phosphatase NrnA [Elusimicrobia bacterium ADurb.Bin231]|nr:MAG: putative bifunctional oligoribonuclease and PAP phosphatase NrnA [Elusimicrobia bacterium ADurb.Bin231]